MPRPRGPWTSRPVGTAAPPEPPGPVRVGWVFILLYTLAYAGAALLFLAPLLVSGAPGVAPLILDASAGSYGTLFTVAGACAICGAVAVLPIKGVR